MDDIINQFLVAGDKFMPEIHLRQPTTLGKPGFTYGACGHLLISKKNKKIKRDW